MEAKLSTKQVAETLADLMTNKERFLDEQHNCPLCGSEMVITHVTHFVNMQVQENAHCEACKMEVRNLAHGLQ